MPSDLTMKCKIYIVSACSPIVRLRHNYLQQLKACHFGIAAISSLKNGRRKKLQNI